MTDSRNNEFPSQTIGDDRKIVRVSGALCLEQQALNLLSFNQAKSRFSSPAPRGKPAKSPLNSQP